MSEINDNPEKKKLPIENEDALNKSKNISKEMNSEEIIPKDETPKTGLSKTIEEKKEAIAKSYEDTKTSIGQSIDTGVKYTKSFFRKLFLYSLIAAVVVVGIFLVWANWTVSEDSRTGYLVKMSKKGYVFKTHEGQLNLGGLQDDNVSVLNSVWDFSVKDTAIVTQLESLEGKKIMIRYKEINQSMPWQGETDYFVFSVEEK